MKTETQSIPVSPTAIKAPVLTTSSIKNESEQGQTHFKGWPNSIGFNASQEQREPKELKIIGSIPSYASGTLYRTGPGCHKVNDTLNGEFRLDHWFDGFTYVHRFLIDAQSDGPTKVTYNSRCTVDNLIENVRKTGKLDKVTFGQKRDPCESLFQKLKQTYEAATVKSASNGPVYTNVGVTVSRDPPGFSRPQNADSKKDVLVTATDANAFAMLDPEILEPLGCVKQTVLHPSLTGPLAAAHPSIDPVTGDLFNYNLDFGRQETYRIYKTSGSTGKTEILATLAGGKVRGAYLHSLFLTADFVILCIWPAYYAGHGAKMLWSRNILEAIAPFDNTAETRWYVIDRKPGRGLVATFKSHAMFCFHSINAFQSTEQNGEVDITCELVEHPNTDALHKMYYENVMSTGKGAHKKMGCNITRYILAKVPLKGIQKDVRSAQQLFQLETAAGGELPTINPNYSTKPHRYVYSVINKERSSFFETICKTDTQTQTAVHWETLKHTPGEPIFVPNPSGESEDDGVLLSVVLDGEKGTSYLLCLDAKTMKELGRAETEIPVGFGFHGSHYAKV